MKEVNSNALLLVVGLVLAALSSGLVVGDEKESTTNSNEMDDWSEFDDQAVLKTTLHNHPLWGPDVGFDKGITELSLKTDMHLPSSSNLSVGHILAYVSGDTMPDHFEDGYDFSKKQYTIVFLKNLEIDLWLASELMVSRSEALRNDSNFSSILATYKPDTSVAWPDTLTLGIKVSLRTPSASPAQLEVTELFESPLQFIDKVDDNANAVRSYRLHDATETYESYLDAVSRGASSINWQNDERPLPKSMNYEFIGGFAPEMFMSSEGVRQTGDTLYYVIKIGAIPVAMGQQSIQIDIPVDIASLNNVQSPSFVRFSDIR